MTTETRPPKLTLEIDLSRQCLVAHESGREHFTCRVSTAANGPGEIGGSGCTPRGRHLVRARIGLDAPHGAVFVGRRPTGEIWSPALAAQYPQRDWILSRILWLSGLEPGRNRLGCVDTFRRYIYLHGTPYESALGTPASHGCIRLANDDIIELARLAGPGTEVLIHP
jgi:lipoprotein-anchoring transpeptidase ErfK/SrfK